MQVQIKHRYTDAVLFECDVQDDQSGIAMRVTLEKATEARANLRDANLRDAYLSGANLRGANLRDANLSGANLRDAYLGGANLSGANLSDANLRDANLRGAYLGGANLGGANLSGANLSDAEIEGEKITVAPIQISGLQWAVLITDGYMRIGCQRHTHADWEGFDAAQIAEMAGNAPEFWAAWKGPLLAMCAAHAAGAVDPVADEVAA